MDNIQPIDILLVDDNEDDVILLQEAFEEDKLANVMEVARDGDEALDYLKKQGKYSGVRSPGLVLLDINMPKKDGFAVLEEIKSNSDLAHIPVVMLTTSERDEDVIRSYKHGACSFIRKPISFDSLREAMRNFTLYWTLVARIPGKG